ncbi:14278_t:CDS:2, partial [Racocetra persica]
MARSCDMWNLHELIKETLFKSTFGTLSVSVNTESATLDFYIPIITTHKAFNINDIRIIAAESEFCHNTKTVVVKPL